MHCRLITWQDPLFLHFIPLVLLVVLPLLLAGERFCIYISHRCSSVCTQQIKEKAKEKSRYAVHPTVHINRSLPTCVLSKALHKVGKRKASSLILLVAWLKPNRGHPLWWWREACRWYISCRYKFGNLCFRRGVTSIGTLLQYARFVLNFFLLPLNEIVAQARSRKKLDKPTNQAPTPTIWHQDPPGSVPEKVGGRPHLAAKHDEFWREGWSYPPNGGLACFHTRRWWDRPLKL